jgi:hypothetical protein
VSDVFNALRARLTALGRAQLEAAGFTDEHIREAYAAMRRGLTAKTRKVMQHKGEIVEGPEEDNSEAQLRAAELVTKIADHHPQRLGIEVDFGAGHVSGATLVGMLTLLGKDRSQEAVPPDHDGIAR